ncbi:MAG: hypothetical protein AB1673_06850 [Actinomycetota bacterium]|jgi:hypothetical protein
MSGPPAPPVPPSPFSDPEVPGEVLYRWFQAEERLYPVAMVMPERYQEAVRLVGRLAEQLRASCPDIPSLVTADAEARDAAQRLASHDPAMAEDLDLSLVAGAACSIRYRELAAQRRG